MNLQVLQWLLRYKRELVEVVSIAKRFSSDMPLMEKWRLVDEIAKVLLPIIDTETRALSLLSDTDLSVSALSLEGEIQALAIDWATLVDVVLPIVISILQAIATKSK
jgi:hypothetical protein